MNDTANPTAESLFAEALNYFHGIGRARNLIRAKELLQQAAASDYAPAIDLLGDWYIKDVLPNQEYPLAVRCYQKGCELGYPQSFYHLAICCDKGRGTVRDVQRAIALYKEAVARGVADACFNLAKIYKKGEDVEPDKQQMIDWYQKGTDMGDADCACNLGFCYYQGVGVAKDPDRAKELFLAHSDYSKLVQKNLGVLFWQGTPACPPDEEQAVYWFTQAANNGEVSAMLNLGKMLRTKNREAAMEWYRKAAESGNRQGAYTYGFYLYKYGKKETWDQSFHWMKQAAEAKHVSAEFMLGLFYKCGVGTEVNDEKAFYWFNLAAEDDYEQAFSHIGRFYRDGRVVAQNFETAMIWFEKAITSDNQNVKSEALFDYGIMYLEGHGVKKNRTKALDYLMESKELGCLNAIKKLEELGNPKMSGRRPGGSDIIDHGNILEYVKMKIDDGLPGADWTTNIVEKLQVFIRCIKECGVVKEGKWTLSNKAFAQWILDVSDSLKLYYVTEKKQRRYYPKYFAALFVTKTGKKFKEVDLRHDMSFINNDDSGKDVRNIDRLILAIGNAKQYIKENKL